MVEDIGVNCCLNNQEDKNIYLINNSSIGEQQTMSNSEIPNVNANSNSVGENKMSLIEKYNIAKDSYNKALELKNEFKADEAQLASIEAQIIDAEKQIETRIEVMKQISNDMPSDSSDSSNIKQTLIERKDYLNNLTLIIDSFASEEIDKNGEDDIALNPVPTDVGSAVSPVEIKTLIENQNATKDFLKDAKEIEKKYDKEVIANEMSDAIKDNPQATPDNVANLNKMLNNSPSEEVVEEVSNERSEEEIRADLAGASDQSKKANQHTKNVFSLKTEKDIDNALATPEGKAKIVGGLNKSLDSEINKDFKISRNLGKLLSKEVKDYFKEAGVPETLVAKLNSLNIEEDSLRLTWHYYFDGATYFMERLGSSNKISGETNTMILNVATQKQNSSIIKFVLDNWSEYIYPNYVKEMTTTNTLIIENEMPF